MECADKERVMITLSCHNKDCGAKWNAKGQIGSSDVCLDYEGDWFCPECGEIGKVAETAPIEPSTFELDSYFNAVHTSSER
jgi:hypothetical protein